MHSYQTKSTTFHFNGSFDGRILIVNEEDKQQVLIPFQDIKEIVTVYLRNELISRIEDAELKDLLRF